MLCGYCRKNQATKTYEQIKKGKKTVEYYCLDCYHRLSVTTDETDLATVCPYCGTTAEEVKKRNLVGCAYCYTTLKGTLFPVIAKMQGGAAHAGKTPLGGETERKNRRRYELQTVAEKLRAEGNAEDAKECERRLRELDNGIAEEDFVWRKRPDLYKRS